MSKNYFVDFVMDESNVMQAEKGAASIRIELSKGGVTIFHGEDGSVLQEFPQVAEGKWSQMCNSIVRQLNRAELAPKETP